MFSWWKCFWSGRHLMEKVAITDVTILNGEVVGMTEHYSCWRCAKKVKVVL